MKASVLIVSKNRKECFRQALASAIRQVPQPEVVAVDDGSDDGTSEMVRREFPEVRLIQHTESKGYIVRRNEGTAACSSEVVFSLDDDAAFSEPTIVAETLKDFSDSRIGAVGIPFINVNYDSRVIQRAPDRESCWLLDAFVGCANAVRRDVFLETGGYWEALIHQGEEMDFCARLLQRGYYVRAGNAKPVLHYHSPVRSFSRMAYYGKRNLILFCWRNVPYPYFWLHLSGTMLNNMRHAASGFEPWHSTRGTLCGLRDIWRYRSQRHPMSASNYLLHRKLKKAGPFRLQDAR